jgi:GT2 family glycosyltransferase
MDFSDVTLLVVPRDHFGQARASLENLLETVPEEVHWVYVDSASPRRVRRWLEAQAARRPRFTLLRHDGFLTPNQARNLGLRHCRTPWLVFLDNDVFGQPGWLEALARCADDTGADLVNPIVCIGGELHENIHLAGGFSRIDETDEGRFFNESHGPVYEKVADARPALERAPVTIVEFHCLLARREAVAKVEPLDERLTATREHLDFGLQLQATGFALWFEPDSVVTYLTPPPFSRGDRRYFLLRWNDDFCRESTEWFYDKWDLPRDQKYRKWIDVHLEKRRRRAMGPWPRWALKLLGKKRANRWIRALERRWVARQLAKWRAT